jgi:hypothetical protein
MATVTSDISRICKDKITFYEGITDFTTITDNDVLVDFVPSWDTVSAVSNTPIVTFTTPNTGAATTDVVLRGVHSPEFATDAANKAYVDGLAITGVSWKNTAHLATSADITTFPPTDGVTTVATIDGVSVVVGDRILVKEQTDPIENGVYLVTAGTWTRAVDVPSGAASAGFAIWVDAGTLYGDKGFVVTSDTGSDVVGTDGIVWANFASSQGVAGSDGDVQINLNDGNSSVTNGSFNWSTTNDNLNIVGGSGSAVALNVSGGRINASSGMNVTAGVVQFNDNVTFTLGSYDLVMVHDGQDTLITSATGDLIHDNTNAAGKTVNRMGDDAGVATFTMENDSEAELWNINSLGEVTHTLGSYNLLDTIPLNIGTGSDLVISHSVDSSIVNSTGIFKVQQTAVGSDLHIENTSTTAGDGIEFKLAASTNGSSFSFIGDSAGSPQTLMEIVAASEDSTSFTTGTVRITGGLAVTQDVTAVCVNMLSDATTKTNIEPLSDPLSKIKQIEGFNYNFLPGYGSSNRMNTGVLAQQIETISGLEHCVTTDTASGYKSVNYTFLIPMMIEGMKELSGTVEKMAAKIKELER